MPPDMGNSSFVTAPRPCTATSSGTGTGTGTDPGTGPGPGPDTFQPKAAKPPPLRPVPSTEFVVAPAGPTPALPAADGTTTKAQSSPPLHLPTPLRSASAPAKRVDDNQISPSHPASAHANPQSKSGPTPRAPPAGGGGGKKKHLARLMLHHVHPTPSAPGTAQEPDHWLQDDDDPSSSQVGDDSSRPTTSGPSRPAATPAPPATPATPAAAPTMPNAQQRWQALKKHLVPPKPSKSRTPSKPKQTEPNLVQELGAGILPVMLLKMSLDKDESGDRRVPVLLHHLRIKVTDSLVAGVQAGHAIFRIELSYGDGLRRWVVYREMRDFVNLQMHYRAAALKGRLGINKPERLTATAVRVEEESIPTLPKFKHHLFWNRDSGTDDASIGTQLKQLGDQLEGWLQAVCRQTALRSDANRLCKFLEISALALALAGRPGVQGKQGFLGVHSTISRKGAYPPGALRFLRGNNQHWCMVRESYLIIAEELGGLKVVDVFLFDLDLRITRPKRIYRHPIPLTREHEHGPESAINLDQGWEEEEEEEVAFTHESSGHPSKAQSTQDPKQNMHEGREIDEHKARGVSAHTFYLINSHQKLKLVAHNERQMNQFVASLQDVGKRNPYAGPNRFDSFAPIRLHVNAKPLVDGRDYYWAVSKALARAKDRIMIHDWWLSPELYLRRPGRPGFRLDSILKQKAEEGVKVFVILYNEVSNNVTPTDSNYSKQRLIALHRNIMVQRSPSHFSTGTFYWAHHEKLCVIDETIAFMGGLDLCFGRWDTPAHELIDDVRADPDQKGVRYEVDDPRFLGPVRDTPEGRIEAHIWPGQDYANERVKEWSVLNKPSVDLFERDKFPRMPWHDVGVQIVGQPARDLARHFIQRWNYLLRIKNHTREMPFLLPPADFSPEEIKSFGLEGTCEAQVVRSGGPWSLGTPDRVEHSIQNAYLKAIENSEHFIYIENQFFITSTQAAQTKIENHIGDALVDRILRAHRDNVPWRAIIVMPLVPGFPLPMDHPDASSVRLIVEAQYRSICRGKYSIFGRLQSAGIDPEEYISFYGLRTWDRLRHGTIVTEQIYPHDKLLIQDDRMVILGSSNINERSQRGDRDSELAIVLRDTDMIDSTMAGEPFKVGRMPHNLRVRLMQEHMGIDVDALQAAQTTPNNGAMHRRTDSGGISTTTGTAFNGEFSKDCTTFSPSPPPPAPTGVPTLRRRKQQPQGLFTRPSPPLTFTASDFEDPIADDFYYDQWEAVAERNTLLYRRALRVVPDDEVKTWSEYKWFMAYNERLAKAQEELYATGPSAGTTSPSPSQQNSHGQYPSTEHTSTPTATHRNDEPVHSTVIPDVPPQPDSHDVPSHVPQPSVNMKSTGPNPPELVTPQLPPGTAKYSEFSSDDIKAIGRLLESTQGHLVQFPLRWLEQESFSGQLTWQSDLLMPLAIFF